MIDVVVRVRRSALALAVLVGMVVALFTACCCLDLDHSSAADPLPVAHVTVQVGDSHDVTAVRDGEHAEDCQESVTAVVVGSASVPGPLVVAAAAAAPMAGQATPRVGTSGSESPPPVPHLLCVMRI